MSTLDFESMTNKEIKELMKQCEREVAKVARIAFLVTPPFLAEAEKAAETYELCKEELKRRKECSK